MPAQLYAGRGFSTPGGWTRVIAIPNMARNRRLSTRINTQGYDSIWSNDIGETKAGLLNNSPDNPYADLKAIYNYYIESDEIIGKEKSVTFTQVSSILPNTMPKSPSMAWKKDLPVGLIKSGLGTLTLSGNNTYTGSTIAAGSVLQINGSVAGDTWSVDSGTIVIGTISSDLTINSSARTAVLTNPVRCLLAAN